MGQIDNESLTLLEAIDEFLPRAKTVRIMTGCVSRGALEDVLKKLLPTCRMAILTGSIAPDLQCDLDDYYDEEIPYKYNMIEMALKSGMLTIGFNPHIHMGIWLFELENESHSRLVIWGSSSLTWSGLRDRKGEQNDCSFEYEKFSKEEARWQRFAPRSKLINARTWTWIKHRSWQTQGSLDEMI